MNNYENFKAIDFINDPSFRDWVYDKELVSETQWTSWLEYHPEKKEEVEIAKLYLLRIADDLPQVSDDYVRVKADDLLRKYHTRESLQEKIRPANHFFRRFAMAASVLLVLGIGLTYYIKHKSAGNKEKSFVAVELTEKDQIEKLNNTASPQVVTLADGSKVTLEPNSSIIYPMTFDDEIRNVQLKGQAFFEVVRNPDKPFVVHFNNLIVKVLGTSFTIRSFDEEKKMSVIVKTGKVSVFTKDDWQKVRQDINPSVRGIILTANQEISYEKEAAQYEKKLVNDPIIIDHVTKENDFIFEESPLTEVFNKLEKAYGIKIVVDENQVKNCTLTASLADEPLIEKLNLICKATNARYEIIDGQIVMNVRSCKK